MIDSLFETVRYIRLLGLPLFTVSATDNMNRQKGPAMPKMEASVANNELASACAAKTLPNLQLENGSELWRAL